MAMGSMAYRGCAGRDGCYDLGKGAGAGAMPESDGVGGEVLYNGQSESGSW